MRASFLFPIAHDEIVRRFGHAHRGMSSEDGEPGPCEYWGFDIDGAHVLVAFHFAYPGGSAAVVESETADIDRVIDALGVRAWVTWRSDAPTAPGQAPCEGGDRRL